MSQDDSEPKNEPTPETEAVVVPARKRRRGIEMVEGSPWARRGLVIGLVAVAAAISGLVLAGLQDGAIYAKPVDELIKEKAKWEGRAVRVEGSLVHGSLRNPEPCDREFIIVKNGVELPVRLANHCAVPDTFVDRKDIDLGVTVEGKLLADNTFAATDLMAKCPSKYDMKEMQQSGQKMQHTAAQQPY